MPFDTATTALAVVCGFISMLPDGIGARDPALMQLLVPHLDQFTDPNSQAMALIAVIVLDRSCCQPLFTHLAALPLPPLKIRGNPAKLSLCALSWKTGTGHKIVPATKIKETGKTYMAKPGELEKKWFLVDAADKVVGRLAGDIAMVLMGKHRPTYTPHVDSGDFVVVVNAERIALTGKKWQQKEYRWYTGYHGLRTETAEHRRGRKPELILTEAVRRMLPKSKLGMKMLQKLKVYAGTEHPHQSQNPEPKELGTKT